MGISFKRPNSRPDKEALIYAVYWGIATAAILIIITAICQKMEYKTGYALSWISYTVLLFSMFSCAIRYKKRLTGEKTLNTRQAYLMCVCMSLTAGTLFVLLLLCYIEWFDPNFVEAFKISQADYWQNKPQISEVEKIDKLQWVQSIEPKHIVLNIWQELVMIGVLFPLIVAVLARKER